MNNRNLICVSWYYRGIKVFYISPSHQNYHCYTCLNPLKNVKCVTNTVEIFAKCGMPNTSLLNMITMFLDNLRDAVANQHPPIISHKEGVD